MLVKISVVFLVVVLESYQIMASCPNIISRSSWGAKAAIKRNNLNVNPPPYVVVHHSETPACTSSAKCSQRVRNIQHYHMSNRGWSDIGYNFLIGGDGNVYEGRGWGAFGSHVPKYNSRSIGICMIGDFQNVAPPAVQLEALKNLIACGVDKNVISSDYHLIGHRQGKPTKCPGNALYEVVKRMSHWESNPN